MIRISVNKSLSISYYTYPLVVALEPPLATHQARILCLEMHAQG